MPKTKMVKVSEETLKLLKSYKKEFGFSSLEESVKNAVSWARLWNYVDVKTRRSMQRRISDLEFQLNVLYEQMPDQMSDLDKRIKALEKAISN